MLRSSVPSSLMQVYTRYAPSPQWVRGMPVQLDGQMGEYEEEPEEPMGEDDDKHGEPMGEDDDEYVYGDDEEHDEQEPPEATPDSGLGDEVIDFPIANKLHDDGDMHVPADLVESYTYKQQYPRMSQLREVERCGDLGDEVIDFPIANTLHDDGDMHAPADLVESYSGTPTSSESRARASFTGWTGRRRGRGARPRRRRW